MMNNLKTLIDFVASLRTGKTACNWACAQTMATLSPKTIEECHELLDAIANKDVMNIEEELGDLLYQLIFYAQLAQEKGWFTFSDVVDNVLEKHYRRMPPVHLRAQLNAEETNAYWQEQKKKEKSSSPLSRPKKSAKA